MKHILTIIILSATILNVNAQTILKKKEVAAKLEEIKNEIKIKTLKRH